jgi:hypothetical protein
MEFRDQTVSGAAYWVDWTSQLIVMTHFSLHANISCRLLLLEVIRPIGIRLR